MPCPHRAAAALGFLPLFLGILIPEACGGRLPEPNELSAKRAVTVGYGLVLSERTDTTVASSQAQLLAGDAATLRARLHALGLDVNVPDSQRIVVVLENTRGQLALHDVDSAAHVVNLTETGPCEPTEHGWAVVVQINGPPEITRMDRVGVTQRACD